MREYCGQGLAANVRNRRNKIHQTSPSFQVSLGDSVSALAEAPFPTAADGKWHRVGLTAHQGEALRLSWDGSDGLGTDVVPSGGSHEHLAFMPNAHIVFGEFKLATG